MRFSQRIPVVVIAVFALVLTSTYTLTPPHSPQTIIDHVGRSVPIPHRIEKVYATSQSGSLLIYALNPALLLGWNTAFTRNGLHLGQQGGRASGPRYMGPIIPNCRSDQWPYYTQISSST